MVVRPTRAEIDDEIVDRAAALFARYGFEETPLQRIADAVGYSKTGLLHRFPSKEALQEAVMARWTERVRGIAAAVEHLPPGPARDRAALSALVDLALDRPGVVSLLLVALTADPCDADPSSGPAARLPGGTGPDLDESIALLLGAFGAPADGDDERNVRVGAALAAVAVVAVTAGRKDTPDQLREHLVAASFDALGHPLPGASED